MKSVTALQWTGSELTEVNTSYNTLVTQSKTGGACLRARFARTLPSRLPYGVAS